MKKVEIRKRYRKKGNGRKGEKGKVGEYVGNFETMMEKGEKGWERKEEMVGGNRLAAFSTQRFSPLS